MCLYSLSLHSYDTTHTHTSKMQPLLISIICLMYGDMVTSAPREKRSAQFFYPGYGSPIYGGPIGLPGNNFYFNPRPFGRARCRLMPANSSQVMGEIFFDQPQSLGPVQISGEVVNLDPGRHGFHIHEMGSTDEDCAAAGTHFNPSNKKHGAPDTTQRHAGDLGNIQAGANRAARFEILDSEISLVDGNPRNVIGRSVVVHAMEDDLGKGEDEESSSTGNAGPGLACCIIEKPIYNY